MRDAEWNKRVGIVEREMLARITKNGWTFMGVPDGGDDDSDYAEGFVYTIGFTGHDKPELIIYLPPFGGAELLDWIAQAHNERAHQPGERWTAPGAKGWTTFRDEPNDQLGMARRIYGPARVRALRVGWQRAPGVDEIVWVPEAQLDG